MNAVGEVQSLNLQAGEGEPHSGGLDASLLRRLYVAQFLTRWGARMWEFSVGLYMIRIWPDSLLLAAIYGVVESSSVAVFGPMVGTLVHRLTYLQARNLPTSSFPDSRFSR
ncbi:hypothetical protein QYE76_001294 [Lolium multiflorum]|uniref:Solute carrier family 40 member n=1 Tax=Lolium multiflorum TaxID=4521 RepID=A0AAD8RL14_LOLMU|nr:hypothetical protein QYE76_001294 [Lolium multiflorum]